MKTILHKNQWKKIQEFFKYTDKQMKRRFILGHKVPSNISPIIGRDEVAKFRDTEIF